jgi:hypothetical protein
MTHLPYLAAHQLIHRLTADQFEDDALLTDATPFASRHRIDCPCHGFFNVDHVHGSRRVARPRSDAIRFAVAALLRRTADRVEPVGVTSGSI